MRSITRSRPSLRASQKKHPEVALAYQPHNLPSVQKAVLAAIRGGAIEVVLDLDHLDALDVSALRGLIALLRRARDAGGELALRATKPLLRRTLGVTALDRVFRMRSGSTAA